MRRRRQGARRGDPLPPSRARARAHLVGVGGEEDVELGPRRSALHVAEPGEAPPPARTGLRRAAAAAADQALGAGGGGGSEEKGGTGRGRGDYGRGAGTARGFPHR